MARRLDFEGWSGSESMHVSLLRIKNSNWAGISRELTLFSIVQFIGSSKGAIVEN
jgi:hypothetical protein